MQDYHTSLFIVRYILYIFQNPENLKIHIRKFLDQHSYTGILKAALYQTTSIFHFFFYKRGTYQIEKRATASHCLYHVVLTQPLQVGPHLTIFSLIFFISKFPETFYIPTDILLLHKINGVAEEEGKSFTSWYFESGVTQNAQMLHSYIKIKEGKSLGKIHMVLSNVLILCQGKNYQD